MTDLREAERNLADAVVLWRLPGAASAVLIDAATQALVDGLDSPTLRELAGEPAGASWFDLAPLVERTVEELGLAHLLTASPERAALTAMVRRFRAGALSAHDLVCWAHQTSGTTDRPTACRSSSSTTSTTSSSAGSSTGSRSSAGWPRRPRRSSPGVPHRGAVAVTELGDIHVGITRVTNTSPTLPRTWPRRLVRKAERPTTVGRRRATRVRCPS